MRKKWICLCLAVLMALSGAPFAFAEGDDPAPAEATLTAVGGTFPYDGKAHAVTYTLTNGEAYINVYFSVDNGETWTKTAPSLTKVGKLTVTVRAVKEGGADPLTATVQLEVTESAAEGSTLTIVNCNTAVNVREQAASSSKKLGQAKKGRTFRLLAVAGNWYKIQYTADKAGYVFHTYGKVGSGTPDPEPDPQPGGQTAYIVNVKSQVNVRAKASSSSKKLGVLKKGAQITVTGASGKWTRIAYKGGAAYVFSHYVSATNPDADVIGKSATIVNCISFVNVRAKANSSSKKLGQAKKGAAYTVQGLSGNWVRVDYNGQSGFIYKRYVKIG